jgi:hypothetical protein
VIAQIAKISAVLGLLAILAGPSIAQFTPPLLLKQNITTVAKPAAPVILNAAVFFSPNSGSGPFIEYTDIKAPPVNTWSTTSCTYTNKPTNYRNPYVYTDQTGHGIKYNGFYWMASNNATFTNTQTSFSLARSTDACSWVFVQEVSTNINVTNQLTYNASFYQDDAGLMHVIAAAGTQSPYQMLIYEWHPLTADPAGSWSAAHLVNYAASPNPAIDPFAVKNIDDGTWRIFYKNDTSPYCMEEATSAGPPNSGVYTLLHNGDWAGWGCGKESPWTVKLNGLWYMFMFDFNNVPQPGHTVYSTAFNLNGAPWSAKATAGIAELGGLGTDAGGMFIGPALPTVVPVSVTFNSNPANVSDMSALHTAVTGFTVNMSDNSTYQGTPTVQSCSQSPCPLGVTGSTGNWSLQTVLSPPLTDVSNATLVINAP